MAKQWWEEAPLAQEQRGEWWEAAPLAQAPAQAKQDEWWKAAPKVEAEEKPQATTSNPFMGILGRAASLAGAGVGAVAEVAERIGDKLELAVPLSGLSAEEVKGKKQLQPLFDWAKSLKDFDESIGYQPSTQLKELGSNPLKAVPFIAERVLTSSPDMVAAAGVLPAYIMSRTKEILDERVKNDEKTLDEATVGDVTAAATAAVVEGTLERFATKGLLKPTPGKTGAGRIGKETATQAGTEVVEEEAAYLGEAAGTKKGLSGEEALTRGLEAAIVGGGLGAGVQGTKEYLNRKPKTPPETVAGQPTTAPAVEEAAAAPAPGVPQVDPARVEQLTLDLIAGGLTPAEAKITAVEVATQEAEDYADNEREAQGAENVAGVDTTAGGAGAPVVGQPGAVSAPAGVGAVEPSGVVSAGQDVGATPAGEAVQQPALTPPSKASVLDTSKYVYHAVRSDADLASIMKSGVAPGTNVSTSHNGQAFAGEGDTILVLPKQEANVTTKGYQNDSVIGKRVFPVAVLKDLSLLPTQPQQATLDALGKEYEKVSAQLAAFDKTLGITEEQRVRLAVRNSEETKKVFGDFYDRIMQLNREENRIFREMDRAESLPQEVSSPTDILQQYSKYGIPAFALDAQYDEGTDNTKLQVSKPETIEGIPSAEEQAALQEELAAEQAKTDVDYAEEAPIPDSVANVIGDLADLAPEIEAETKAETEAAPKGKRGPKGARLTPEQKAASDKRRQQQTKDWKSNKKAVDAADTALNDALTPLDPEGYDSLEAAQEAVESKRISKIQAIKSLMLLGRVLKGTELGARVETLLKNPAITAKELADIKAGIAAQVSKSAAQVKVGRADTRFNGMTTGQQALRHVIKTGNPFQKFLAQRLLPFVKDVRFQVIEEDAPLPPQITEGGAVEDWDASRGLFLRVTATGERFVFVRGATGGPSQGVNNVTVLHEMLHAALNKKMDMADWALRTGYDRTSDLAKAFKSLQDTIRLTQERMADMQEAGTLPESMYQLVDSGIFTDAREFVAYAMTDPAFQKFLMETPGALKQSLFTRFVNNVRQFFNMGPMHTSALSDVISITDKMISTRMTSLMRNEVKDEQLRAKEAEVSSQLKSKKKKVNATETKLAKSNAADTFRDLGTLTKLRSMSDLINVLSSGKAMKNAALRQLLPMLQTSAVVQWADRNGIKGIKEAWQYIGDMVAMRNKLTNDLVPISNALAKLHRKNIQQFKALANVMHYSTLLSRDPTKPFYLLAGTGKDRISMSFTTAAERDAYVKANAQKLQDLGGGREFTDSTLERLWNELTPDVKKLYSQVRDFYADNHALYQDLLQDQINASKLDPTAQKKVIAELKKMYEDGKKLYPYFPLMRYGQFWLRVGKGKNREFYMFESEADRDAFAEARAKQLGESFDDLMDREEMDVGNDLSDARKNDKEPSSMLKKMFEAIDQGAVEQSVTDDQGNLVSTGMSNIDVERLKDEIYQMYLQTLPDRNFRRQFMHRQGTTGFTGDIARNFAVTGTNMANQLARIKYGAKVMGEIDRANDSLKGNPNKARLGEFVTEMRMRAEQQVRPNPEDGIAYAASNLLNQSAYLWLMTSVKTAVAQLTAIPIFVGPVLTSNHGFNPAKVAGSLTKSLAIFGSTGIKRTAADGTSTYEFPSMLNNQLVKLTGDEKLAAQYMVDRGLSDTTLAYELGDRRSTPTQEAQNAARRVLRVSANTMTALFHHTERMIREVTFMTSYRLYRDEINPTTKKKYTHEEALPLAEAETYQALGNYHASERPRGIGATAERGVLLNAHKPLGRSLLQFKMFPAFVTTFFIRNAYRMFAGLDAKDRAKAMAQLFGTLAMSGTLAGYAGVPGASMLMGVIQGMMNVIRWAKDDEDEDDPLDERDLEFSFRNKWLPNTFGSIKIGDHTLDEVLDRGLLATMTGYDISGSLSLNNMWVPEVKESATASAAMQEYLMSLAGPGISLTFKQIPKAIDYFNKGEILRGFEQLSPAFARGAFTAERYEREGATTASGAVIKDADEFTKGQLWAQRFGFATEGLVAQREAIFHLQGEILKVKRERTELLDRLERELDQGNDEDVEKVLTKMAKFNASNPFDAIKYENIKASLKKQIDRKMKTDRGMPTDKKYYPQVAEILQPSVRKLEREAEAAKQ